MVSGGVVAVGEAARVARTGVLVAVRAGSGVPQAIKQTLSTMVDSSAHIRILAQHPFSP